jgi:outer membrane receptor protein involved in Fe transport
MKFKLTLLISVLVSQLQAQVKQNNLQIKDSNNYLPIESVVILDSDDNLIGKSDENGYLKVFQKTRSDSITITAAGYSSKKIAYDDTAKNEVLTLSPAQINLKEVMISADNLNPNHLISQTDIKLRSVSNSQEVLRIIPGLFIGQHQGGGKAEQIFLRGFDNDHGTDINLSVDGLPVNMVSHAHGQGYADTHFIIPETIEKTNYEKGMYNASKGDLAVSGYAEFQTAHSLKNNVVKFETGLYKTLRTLVMVNLLPEKIRDKQSWYMASEYNYSDGYFDNPQHFKRFNFFTKYHGQITKNNTLDLSASTFHSSWMASGQIPDYAVQDGLIGFFGSLDPNEGGKTNRTNLNASLFSRPENGDVLKNQFYYSNYSFDLNSNFTFYLEDPVNGDQIRQKENRNLLGYNGSYSKKYSFGKVNLTSTIGLNGRTDWIGDSQLTHVIGRNTVINPVKNGDITELQGGAFLNNKIEFSPDFTLEAGIRFDYFNYQYKNQYAQDQTLTGIGKYSAHNSVLSPKLKFLYKVRQNTQLYWFFGKGFHSNDVRGAIIQNARNSLPCAYGSDLGIVFKASKQLLFNASLWYSYLQNQYVYGGDGGSVEFSGKTRRIGFDISARYQPITFFYLDADLNYAHGRARDNPDGENYIPLAPVWSSTAGINLLLKNGINGSLRYRYLADRPANENYSLLADGYFVNDLVLNYTKKRFEIGLVINNLFDVKWKETQFETLTRLQNRDAVNSIAFTPGTKFAALLHLSVFF